MAEEEDQEQPDPEVLAVLEEPERRIDLRRIVSLVVAVVLAVVLIALLVRWTRQPWRTVPAATGEFVEEVSAVGTVEPAEVVEIGSRQSGTVERVEVQVNDQVAAGTVLALLDTAQLDLAVRQAEEQARAAASSVVQALADSRQAERDLERIRRLHAQDAATTVELTEAITRADAASAQVRSLRAQAQAARASVRSAQEDVAQAHITSPIAGVVLRVDVEPGATVVSAFEARTLFVVASSLDQMVAEVDIDEADIVRVQAGQPASFTVTAWPDATFSGVVTRVDLAPDPSSTTVVYVAELAVENPDGALRPGMTVTARIEVERLAKATLIPVEALRYQPEGVEAPEGEHVWTLRRRRPVPVAIQVLGDDGTHAAVEGIEPGTPIIVEDSS